MHSRNLKIATALMAVSLLSACALQRDEIRRERVSEVNKEVKNKLDPARQAVQPVKTVSGQWVFGGTVERRIDQPTAPELDGNVRLVSADPVGIDDFAAMISDQTGLTVVVSPDVYQDPTGATEGDEASVAASGGDDSSSTPGPGMAMRVGPTSATSTPGGRYPPYLTPTAIRYEGPLRGLLSRVTSRYSLYWTYEAGRVVIARYATRTFKLSALPSQVVVSAEVGGTAAAAGDTGSEVTSTTDGITQRAAYTMEVNLWKAVESAVDAMLSPNGRLFVSKETGALTVTDTVDVQRLVESYVKDLNRDLQRQVNVRVTVLSVNIDDEDAYGINWDVIRQNSDSLLEFVTPDLISTAAGSLTGTVVKPSSRWNGSSAVIKALSTIGRTSVVTQSSLTTLNGQPAPIQVTESTGYLKEVTTTLTDTGTETGLTPGTILTGVVMTVTPRVVGHSQMMLQYSLDFSELLDIKEFSSGTNTIQLPEIAKRALTQQVLISNGEMLILSGLETTRERSKTEGVEGQWWLGGRDSGTNRERLVVVIEPMLIGARSVAAAD